MKKLINGERYNQEIAMHTGYHLQITATEAAYLVSGGRYFTRTDDLEYRGRVMQHPGMRDYLASELKKQSCSDDTKIISGCDFHIEMKMVVLYNIGTRFILCSDAGFFATFYAISFDDFRHPKCNGEAGKYGNRA